MARRWYVGNLPIVVQNDLPSVQHGESRDFPESRLASLGGEWVAEDPSVEPIKTLSTDKSTTTDTEPDIEPENDEEE
jgi:hypothetical protein